MLNILKHNGINTVQKMIKCTENNELKYFVGFGKKSISEIEQLIHSLYSGDGEYLLVEELPVTITAYSRVFNTAIQFWNKIKNIFKRHSAENEISNDKKVNNGKITSIFDYINNMPDDRTRQIILYRFDGKTLEEIGRQYGVTRERIRQIYSGALRTARRKNKHFDEDKYVNFFQRYSISKDDFTLAFSEPPGTYEYLRTMAQSNPNKKSLELALEDDNIPLDMRENLKKVICKDFILINGKRINKNWSSLVNYYIEKYCTNLTNFEDFMRNYQDFLKMYSKETFEINERTCKAYLLDSMCVLWSPWQKFRYYKIQSRNYDNFLEKINLSQYDGLEISTLKIFRENPELMEQYDIHDEYELHNLLKKISDKLDNKIKFTRMPTIEV